MKKTLLYFTRIALTSLALAGCNSQKHHKMSIPRYQSLPYRQEQGLIYQGPTLPAPALQPHLAPKYEPLPQAPLELSPKEEYIPMPSLTPIPDKNLQQIMPNEGDQGWRPSYDLPKTELKFPNESKIN